jgi:hypothetical protein
MKKSENHVAHLKAFIKSLRAKGNGLLLIGIDHHPVVLEKL